MHLFFLVFLNYNALLRYRNVMAAHSHWKKVHWNVQNRLYFGVINIIELCFWIGLPVVILFYVFLVTLISTLEEKDRPVRRLRGLLVLQALAILVIPALSVHPLKIWVLVGVVWAAAVACFLVVPAWSADTREKIMVHVCRSVLLLIGVDTVMLSSMGALAWGAVVLALLVPSYFMVGLYRRV